MFFRRKFDCVSYDAQTEEPAVRRSICTGEMSAGFVDKRSGRFREVMSLSNQQELEAFKKAAGVSAVKVIY